MNASFNTLGTSTYLNTGPFNPTGGQPRWKDWANYSAAQSVTINTTAPGWVYISAFGNLQDGNNLVDMEIDLGISTSVVGPPDSGGTYWPRYNSNVLSAYSVSHFYHNTTSGTFTYYLLAAGSDATITPGSLVALFVPD